MSVLPLRDSTSRQQQEPLWRTHMFMFHRAWARHLVTKGQEASCIQQSREEPSARKLPALPTCLQQTQEHLLEKQTQPCCPGDTSTEISTHSHEPPQMLSVFNNNKKAAESAMDTESKLSLQRMWHSKDMTLERMVRSALIHRKSIAKIHCKSTERLNLSGP